MARPTGLIHRLRRLAPPLKNRWGPEGCADPSVVPWETIGVEAPIFKCIFVRILGTEFEVP